MSVLVVDASIAIGWALDSPHSAKCAHILRSPKSLVAPDLIIPEIANAFYMQSKNKTTDASRLRDGLQLLPRWFAELVPCATLRGEALDLALELNHPAYDCFYLALALMRDARFVTTDARFRGKAVASGYRDHVLHLDDWREW